MLFSIIKSLLTRSFPKFTILCLIVFAHQTYAQQPEFVPKSRMELLREKQEEQKERKKIVSSGILTVTSTKFAYRFGKIDNKGVAESFVRYDSRGNKIRETIYSVSDGTIYTTTSFRYDKNNNLLEEIVKKDENTFKTVHRYDASNNKTESVFYRPNGTVEKKIAYVYDDTGLLLETIGRLDDGRTFMRESYVYDGTGNLTEYKSGQRKFSVSYDQKGNIISLVKYARYFRAQDSVQYNINEFFTFRYNSSGFLIETQAFRADSTLRSRTQYLVNSFGLLLEEKTIGTDGKISFVQNFTYDKNKNIIEESGSDRALKFKNVYKYDSRGNRTEWITYDQINEPVSVTKYTFGRTGSTTDSPQIIQQSQGEITEENEEFLDGGNEYYDVLGCRIIAPDGSYLGMVLADTSNPQSIINAWGQYGFSQSPSSIFNPTIPYGGESGIFSPFNVQSPSPPSIYKEGKFFTYLTDNESYRPRLQPQKLVEFLKMLVKQN